MISCYCEYYCHSLLLLLLLLLFGVFLYYVTSVFIMIITCYIAYHIHINHIIYTHIYYFISTWCVFHPFADDFLNHSLLARPRVSKYPQPRSTPAALLICPSCGPGKARLQVSQHCHARWERTKKSSMFRMIETLQLACVFDALSNKTFSQFSNVLLLNHWTFGGLYTSLVLGTRYVQECWFWTQNVNIFLLLLACNSVLFACTWWK